MWMDFCLFLYICVCVCVCVGVSCVRVYIVALVYVCVSVYVHFLVFLYYVLSFTQFQFSKASCCTPEVSFQSIIFPPATSFTCFVLVFSSFISFCFFVSSNHLISLIIILSSFKSISYPPQLYSYHS